MNARAQHTASARLSSREKRMAQRRREVARCAELLAEGYTLGEAAKALCIAHSTAETYLATIRKDLGWQAS